MRIKNWMNRALPSIVGLDHISYKLNPIEKWFEFYARLKNNESIETKSKKIITAVQHYIKNLEDTGRVSNLRIEEEKRFLETRMEHTRIREHTSLQQENIS